MPADPASLMPPRPGCRDSGGCQAPCRGGRRNPGPGQMETRAGGPGPAGAPPLRLSRAGPGIQWRQVTANNLKVMRLPTGSTMIRVRVSAWLRLRRLTGRLSYSVAGPAGEAWLKSSCRPGPEATPRPAHCARHQSPSHAALAIIMIALAHQPPGTRKGRRAAAARPATGRGPRLTGRTRRNLKSPRRRRVREISRWSLLLGRLKLVRASPSGPA